jgi:hypothetical protein
VQPSGFSKITIYSKSGRDSTLDRHAVHWAVREALGLPHAQAVPRCTVPQDTPIQNVVLEAEMVAYSRELDRIDGTCGLGTLYSRPFSTWHLRVLAHT